MSTITTTQKIQVADGSKVFYREAGYPGKPKFLLLHGFPTSSHMFRTLIPLLAPHFHVVAPDFPGFGFTEVPEDYEYTFDNLANTVEQFTDALKLGKYAVYIFDYGAPIAIRLALRTPERILAIVSQNGNAYIEGLRNEFWDPIAAYWEAGKNDVTYIKALGEFVEDPKNILSQYYSGVAKPETIDPINFSLDQFLISRPGQTKIQTDLFFDYGTNKALYPPFQKYLRDSKVPLLLVWGKNDKIFEYPAAEAFKKDVKDAKLIFYPTGHFTLETHVEPISKEIISFLNAKI